MIKFTKENKKYCELIKRDTKKITFQTKKINLYSIPKK